MQPIRKFMLASPAWVIFILTAVGPVISLVTRGKVSDSLYAQAASTLSAVCVALWCFSTITVANGLRSQFKPWVLILFALILVCYVTLPFGGRFVSEVQSPDSGGYSSTFASTLIVLWGLVAGVGGLVVAFFAWRSLFTSGAVGESRLGNIILGFLAFALPPLGVWYLQPKLTELHRRAA